jgi:DNA-directed RNA polymerase I, II, and III subunit RPABC5
MIIPIRCMNCGKLVADKWRFYQKQLTSMKGEERAEQRVYFDGMTIPETVEKKVLDGMGINRSCCRKHFLTQVDLIDKI